MHEVRLVRRIVRWQTSPREAWVLQFGGEDEECDESRRQADLQRDDDNGWKPKRYTVSWAGRQGKYSRALIRTTGSMYLGLGGLRGIADAAV